MLKFLSAWSAIIARLGGIADTLGAIDGSLKEAHANLRVNLALDQPPPALTDGNKQPADEEESVVVEPATKKGRGGNKAAAA